ncbi:hypothetical protein SAMN05428981_1011309 [Bacillus sp. OV194]|nr:hypothetical protein SAMN05428981_1011309 [Bacillus sp. OV194]
MNIRNIVFLIKTILIFWISRTLISHLWMFALFNVGFFIIVFYPYFFKQKRNISNIETFIKIILLFVGGYIYSKMENSSPSEIISDPDLFYFILFIVFPFVIILVIGLIVLGILKAFKQ